MQENANTVCTWPISREDCLTLVWKFGVVSAILAAFFWGGWFLFTGHVPVVSEFTLWSLDIHETIVLPFEISRCWDVIAAPIWTTLMVLVVTISSHARFNTEVDSDKIVGSLAFLCFCGALFGVHTGMIPGLILYPLFVIVTAIAPLVVGAVIGTGRDESLEFMVTYGIGVGIGFGLSSGLIFGLAVGIMTVSAGCMGAGIGYSIRAAYRLIFCRA